MILIDWSRLKQVHGRVTPFAVLGQAHGERRWRLWLPISLGVPCTHAYQGDRTQPAALVYRGESWPELRGLVALPPGSRFP